MKRARATMAARKPLVPAGSMSGRARQPSSGAASRRPISSSITCGGGSSRTCIARHSATRTAVLSGAAVLSGVTVLLACHKAISLGGHFLAGAWRLHRRPSGSRTVISRVP